MGPQMCVPACVVDLLFPHDAIETQRKIEVNASGNSDDDGNTRIQCTVNVSAYTRMKCVQNDALHLEIKPNCSAKPQIGSLLILRTFRVPFKTPNTFYRACIERNFVLVQHSLSGCVCVVLYVFLDNVCLFVCCFACWLLVLRLLLMFILVCVSLYFTRSVDLIGTANVWSFFLFFVNKSCLHISLLFRTLSPSRSHHSGSFSFWLHKSIYIPLPLSSSSSSSLSESPRWKISLVVWSAIIAMSHGKVGFIVCAYNSTNENITNKLSNNNYEPRKKKPTQSLLSEQSNGKRNKANERWNE